MNELALFSGAGGGILGGMLLGRGYSVHIGIFGRVVESPYINLSPDAAQVREYEAECAKRKGT
jgi:hypothetical protein